jgi:hypothetical protein
LRPKLRRSDLLRNIIVKAAKNRVIGSPKRRKPNETGVLKRVCPELAIGT